ncbi:MAG: hypothetical protein O9313_03130 [Acetobacteraceae bacterium]|nr:hypothetical protein [Acetobacteraceae bacterium]
MDKRDCQIGRRLCERANGQLEARKQAMTHATPDVMIPKHGFQWAGHFRGPPWLVAMRGANRVDEQDFKQQT